MSAKFFFDRLQRAIAMDGAMKLNRQLDASEWLDAYKSTLSKNQLDKFNKEWRKCEDELELAHRKVDFGK